MLFAKFFFFVINMSFHQILIAICDGKRGSVLVALPPFSLNILYFRFIYVVLLDRSRQQKAITCPLLSFASGVCCTNMPFERIFCHGLVLSH